MVDLHEVKSRVGGEAGLVISRNFTLRREGVRA